MFKNETTIDIQKPADQVFAFILNLSQWRGWRYGHIEAKQTSEGSLGVGATFKESFWIVPPFKSSATYQITALEPTNRVEYVTLQSPVQARIWFSLQPVPDGTRVIMGNETESTILFRVFQRIFPKMGQQMIEGEAKKLKDMLEAY